MASIDQASHEETNIIDNLLSFANDLPAGNTSNEAAVGMCLCFLITHRLILFTETPATETVELRTLSDGSVAALPLKKRKVEEGCGDSLIASAVYSSGDAAAIESFEKAFAEPVTPVKKAKKVKAAPPAPVKPVSVPRVVATGRSPVVDMILKGLDVYPEAINELVSLTAELNGPCANYTLQRLLATFVGKIAAVGEDDRRGVEALRQLLLICYGYASVGQEQRVVLRETIKLPNFISKDSTVVTKHCKSLLGQSFPQEQQATVIAVMRGLWHLFERVAILPTVWHNSKWVYETLDDCKNKATSL